jgi:hypothetical protein
MHFSTSDWCSLVHVQMYTMSLDAITSSADAITVLPEACAKVAARSASMSKHPPRTIGTPLIFSIFE